MVRGAIIETFLNSWPMFVIVLVILVTLRISDYIINKRKISLYKELITLGFISYILCLFYIVSFEDVDWSTSNYSLFTEILRYEIGSRLFFKNVMNNILMFLPYGFFISYYLKPKSMFPIIILATITSTSIELTQLAIGRVFDVDDILLNVIGAVLGFYVYRFANSSKESLPKFLQKEWFYNLLSIIFLIIIIFYILNVFNFGVFPW